MNTLPTLGTSKSAALRAFYRMKLNEQRTEEVESKSADRAARLGAFFESEVWALDVLPILRRLYDDCLDEVKLKQLDPDALKVLDDLIVRLGGSLTLGIGAMQRIAQRRLEASEKLAEMQNI